MSSRFLYRISIAIVCASLILLIWFLFSSSHRSVSTEENNDVEIHTDIKKSSCEYRRRLDGVCVEHEEDVENNVIAIMVENHFEARPQSGLSNAHIVYEAPVEGNISRFLLIFLYDDDVSEVGPVRSARPYYLDWVHEYGDALYMHVGGSPTALTRIKQENVYDFNEFYNGNYYWRGKQRYAPHNVYTSSDLWREGLTTRYKKDDMKMLGDRWQFESWKMCEDTCIEHIFINFDPPTYSAEWRFNEEKHNYIRYQSGALHSDKDGSVIVADTIIVQETQTKVIDNEGRLSMDTIGRGPVHVFAQGHEIDGYWKKDSVQDVTKFFREDGTEIALHPGKIWIEVLGTPHTFEVN